ncbi:mur ligase family, glutamate ligase, partial [Salmonella enterica subsp. enterica serovar Poona]
MRVLDECAHRPTAVLAAVAALRGIVGGRGGIVA